MHQYDVASKILMESCRDEIIRFFAGMDVEKSELAVVEEVPQETVSLKRSDFPVMVTDKNGKKNLLLFELQTRWNDKVPLHLLDHRTRYQLKFDLDPTSFVILLTPSSTAADTYKNREVGFTFNLIRIYEMDAAEIIDGGPVCLLPFVPLMRNGPELLEQADNLIYKSERTRMEKADLLTSMAILSGIISRDLPVRLINRRKDIMIESAAYDIIKQDGIQEGIQQGIQQGMQQGIQQGMQKGIQQGMQKGIQQGMQKGIQQGVQQGMQKGMLLEAREMLREAIEMRFNEVPDDISALIDQIESRDLLKSLLRKAIASTDVDELRNHFLL